MSSHAMPNGHSRINHQAPTAKNESSPDVDIEDFSKLNLGYDFENQQTRSQLELMDDLQRLGVSKYLDLPQLVVMGEQSVGKSSVLQAVTEIPFLTGDGMCTRFATEIVLRRTKPGTPTLIQVCIIPDADETPERKQILRDWAPEGLDPTTNLDKSTMKDIFDQAEGIIFQDPIPSPGRKNHASYPRSGNRLSSSILQITRSGPKETNFAIVDIPGLVRGQSRDRKSEHQTAKALVEKYLNNIRSIIVVVIDVVDLERHAIFDLISDLPDKESRVIGVVNKCDTKQKQSADWVFDLIRNVDNKHSKQYLKEGWYGLRNRAAAELLVSDEERDRLEEKFFETGEWKSLNSHRLGRHYLKEALIKMRNNHIKRSIPELLTEIDRELDGCAKRIDQLGEPRTTTTAQFALINKIATNYSRMASGAVDGHYKSLRRPEMYARKLIRDNLDDFQINMRQYGVQKQFRTCDQDANLINNIDPHEWSAKFMTDPIYTWIRESVRAYRALEDGNEVNPEVKIHLWKEQITSWSKISSSALSSIERTVESVNEALFTAACPDRELLRKLLVWLNGDFQLASDAAHHELKRIVDDENGGVITYNPLRVQKQSVLRTQRIEAIKKRLLEANPQAALPQSSTGVKFNPINVELLINSLLHQDPELVGILNTHDSIAAYYEISLYRFVDNFALQVIERHLLGPTGPLRLFNSDYITRRLHGEENAATLNELAGEKPEVARERDLLENKRASLEEARKRAQGFKML